MHGTIKPEDFVASALNALIQGPGCDALLDQIPLPLYTTDAAGLVTYSNPAAARFAGRQPTIGQDRWCVTARLFSTAGEPIPHDRCPMAEALESGQAIRDRVAVAERPNGTRVAFRAFPTPILDADGRVVGGLNLLVDVTEEQSSSLVEQADRCRRLAQATYDRSTSSTLDALADGFTKTAEDLRRASAAARATD